MLGVTSASSELSSYKGSPPMCGQVSKLNLSFSKSGWVKLGSLIVEIYRPPSIIRSQWSHELSSLFEATSTLTSTVLYAGDFNADLL